MLDYVVVLRPHYTRLMLVLLPCAEPVRKLLPDAVSKKRMFGWDVHWFALDSGHNGMADVCSRNGGTEEHISSDSSTGRVRRSVFIIVLNLARNIMCEI